MCCNRFPNRANTGLYYQKNLEIHRLERLKKLIKNFEYQENEVVIGKG